MNNIRLKIIIISSFVISLLIIIRIIYLSTMNPEDFILYEKNELNFNRGNIYDRNGKILAISNSLYSLYAIPTEIANKKERADKISKILNIKSKDIFDLISFQFPYN